MISESLSDLVLQCRGGTIVGPWHCAVVGRILESTLDCAGVAGTKPVTIGVDADEVIADYFGEGDPAVSNRAVQQSIITAIEGKSARVVPTRNSILAVLIALSAEHR